MTKKYYLGLDMGTSSLGWAVTDENYNLMRIKGKDLWGVRLFSEAKTAAERRTNRTSRRRLQREKARNGYLRELFEKEINKIDPGFYQRLDDSKYLKEDKEIKQPYALFADNGYTDKEYYKDYPTIFHLRKELAASDKPHDVRLVYLAIANMYKHRGHFLNVNLGDDGIGNLKELYSSLKEMVLSYSNMELPDGESSEVIGEILASKEYSNTRKQEEILNRLNISKTKEKAKAEMIKLICGLKGTISTIFENEVYDEETRKVSVSFREGQFDEKQEQIEEILSEEAYEIFMLLKQIHDWGLLANIMKGENGTYEYLSDARVDSYEKHKKDLKILKSVIKKYAPDEYNDIFRIMKDNNYSAYVGSVNSGKEVKRRGAKAKTEEFYKKIKKLVEKMPEDENVKYILKELEKETFLPKQLTSENGVIPNQVHKAELKKILNNAEKYLEFLKEKDETGLTVSEKIIRLFEFQIPYYVGPLNNTQDNNAWSIRKEQGRIMPWNFKEKIDVKESAEKFIEKMVNHCTYLSGETVLPKNSLLYEKFRVLNELNNLRINGEKIKVKLKQNIYNELFKPGKKVTLNKLKTYLKINVCVENSEEIEISGIDGGFTNTLSNYAKFTALFETDTLTYEQEQIAEKIIFWSTVYGEEKKFLKEKIEKEYEDILSAEKIKRITGYKFKDWGRLSKEFLELEGIDKETGEKTTIISKMWNDNYNLMELLSNKFTYKEEVEKKTEKIEKILTEIEYEDLDDLYISAPVKRMTWQTILVLKELYEVIGEEPAKIFVEMARDVNAEKKRTTSRKKKFLELYKKCKDDEREWSKEIADTDEAKFRSKKLYLYYTQKGRCMYTGNRIELLDLFNNNLYDIDHIYPRHFVKDDSIENNLVLVQKEINQNNKKDNFPIEISIRREMKSWWKTLREGGFITEEKYKRLTREYEFSDDEKANFIGRQIIETRQGTKVITDLFEQTFRDSEIIYVKAVNVSTFRQKYDLIKCRNVNDFHHAQDAYLNIVVGNVYNVKFTKNPYNFIKEYKKAPERNPYHMDKMFEFTVKRGNETAWKVANGESISVVRKVMGKNTPLVTRMNYEEHGGIADQTIYSASDAAKKKGEGYISIKETDEKISDVCKYGGYKKYTGTYFFLVEYTLKEKRVRSIEAMPLYKKEQLNTIEKLEQYCREQLKYEEPSIRLKKIKMYSLIKVDGFYLYLTGRSGKQLLVSNAVQLSLEYKYVLYIKKISSAYERKLTDEQLEDDKDISKDSNMELYNVLKDKHLQTIYKKRPNPAGDKLAIRQKEFENLSVSKQIYVLLQILQLSQLTNSGADLTEIGESKAIGKMQLNKKISDRTEFKLINQSVTGLYQNEIDLLKV